MKFLPAFVILALSLPLIATPVTIVETRANQQINPTSVPEIPVLSWKLSSNERGKRQSAYQIIAATEATKLEPEKGDLWNSEKITTGLSHLVPWSGPALKLGQSVHWKVRVWDETDTPSDWSAPATFTVGQTPQLTSPARTSSFESNSPQINQLHQAQVDLLAPRLAAFAAGDPSALGEGASVHGTARAMLYHFDSAPLLKHWINLMDQSLTPDDFFPILPGSSEVGTASSEAAITVTHPYWWMSGDSSVPTARWTLFEKHMIARENADRSFLGRPWGKAPKALGVTPEYLDLCTLAFTTRLIRELSVPASQPYQVIRFQDYAARLRASFEKQYLNDDGSLKIPSQTAHLLALRSQVLKPEQQAKVIADLIAQIQKNGPEVGPVGAYFLPTILSLTGHHDLAVDLLHQLTPEQTQPFLEAGLGEWLMSQLAGIDTTIPGFQQILLAPRIPTSNKLTWVTAHYDSPRGRVNAHWKKLENQGLLFETSIPVGALARIILPMPDDFTITEGGNPIAESPAVEIFSHTNGTVTLISQSGYYSFEIKAPEKSGDQ